MRAITHIHTRHSPDSLSSPKGVVERLVAQGVELALISDHDSFAGSIEARHEIEKRGLSLRIPFAAEVLTEYGDVIVVFEDEPPALEALKNWETLRREVRARGGLIWLPHPYQSHSEVEMLAADADVIEVFNARCSEEKNRQARSLCERHGKTAALSADAHLPWELKNCVVDYPLASTAIESLRQSPHCLQSERTPIYDISLASGIKACKRRQPRRAVFCAAQYLKRRLATAASSMRF